jgi:2-C-methyl-D-erythritol 4-phosphate cytidylyltransferase
MNFHKYSRFFNMQPTLVIMAAGMGSRYGGLKQLDRLGPNGETIMDYSIYDALRSGFGEIVFVIRESFSKEFNRVCVSVTDRISLSGSSPRNWIIYRPLFLLPRGERNRGEQVMPC